HAPPARASEIRLKTLARFGVDVPTLANRSAIKYLCFPEVPACKAMLGRNIGNISVLIPDIWIKSRAALNVPPHQHALSVQPQLDSQAALRVRSQILKQIIRDAIGDGNLPLA